MAVQCTGGKVKDIELINAQCKTFYLMQIALLSYMGPNIKNSNLHIAKKEKVILRTDIFHF